MNIQRKQDIKKFQGGFSALGWLIILCVGGFLLTFLLKVFPAYIDNKYIVVALESLHENNPGFAQMEKHAIKNQIDKYLTINSVRGEAAKSFEIKKFGHRTIVNANYEVRSNLIGNIDIVVVFKNQLDSDNPDKCCEFLVKDFDENR